MSPEAIEVWKWFWIIYGVCGVAITLPGLVALALSLPRAPLPPPPLPEGSPWDVPRAGAGELHK